MKLAIVVMLAALSVGAQTANVIELEPSDTARAQKAWDALQKAQAAWDKTIADTAAKYVYTVGEQHQIVPGFESGFEFSKDFRFIVPKQIKQQSNPWGIQYNGIPNIGNIDCSKGPC